MRISVIHKQPLLLTDEQVVELPLGAKILSVQAQSGQVNQEVPMIWYRWESPAERETRKHRITIVGTGHTFDSDVGTYIGTVQFQRGMLVFHFFEKRVD